MARFSTKRINFKGIIAGVVAVVVIIGAIAGIAALTKNTTKTIGSGAFKVGDLNANGEYAASEQTVYTEQAFDCRGLRVESNFEFKGTYDVYYYDNDGRFIEAVEDLKGTYDEDYPFAVKARIVVNPEIPDGVKASEFKINFWEVAKYASSIKITVDKDQSEIYDFVDQYDAENVSTGVDFGTLTKGEVLELTEDGNETVKITEKISVSEDYSGYDVFIRVDELAENMRSIGLYATSADDKLVSSLSFNMNDVKAGEWVRITFDAPKANGDLYFRLRLPIDAECHIFGITD